LQRSPDEFSRQDNSCRLFPSPGDQEFPPASCCAHRNGYDKLFLLDSLPGVPCLNLGASLGQWGIKGGWRGK
jgi:hypothetical protein